jgi:hypothetical protein
LAPSACEKAERKEITPSLLKLKKCVAQPHGLFVAEPPPTVSLRKQGDALGEL